MTDQPTDFDLQKPIFEMDDHTKVDTFWFLAGDGWDFMGGVYTDPQGRWMAKYRFRHYDDPKEPFDDTKRVYELTPAGPTDADRDELVLTMSTVVHHMERLGAGTLYELPIKGGVEDFTHILSKQHFAHVRLTSEEPKGVQ